MSKIKRGDLNSSMSSNEHEEVPVPKKPLKKGKHQEKEIVKETKEVVVEAKIEKESEMQSQNYHSEEFQDEVGDEEFDLGFGENFNSWKPSLNYNPCFEEEREINAMIQREEDYKDDCKNKQERKTAEGDEEEIAC